MSIGLVVDVYVYGCMGLTRDFYWFYHSRRIWVLLEIYYGLTIDVWVVLENCYGPTIDVYGSY
jgi:hypothetical protein